MSDKFTQELEVKVKETGADEAAKSVDKLNTNMTAATKSAGKLETQSKSLGAKLGENKERFSAVGSAAFAASSALQASGGSATQLVSGLGAVTGAMSAIPGPVGLAASALTALLGIGSSVIALLDKQVDETDQGVEAWARYSKAVEAARTQLGDIADFASPARIRRIRELMDLRGGDESMFSTGVSISKLQAAVIASEDALARRKAIAEAKGTVYNIDQVVIAQKNLDIAKEGLAQAQKRAAFAEDELEFATKQTAIEAGRAEEEKKTRSARAARLSEEVAGLGATFHAAIQGFIETAFYADQAYKQELAALDELEKREQARYKLQNTMNAERERAWAKEKAQRKQAKELDKDNLERSREATEAAIDKGEAYFNVAAAALIAGESVIGAIKKQLNAEAQAEFLSSSWNALKYGALSIARFAMGDPVGGAAFAQSAGMFTTIAALTGGAVAATGGFGGGGGGGGGSGGDGGTAPSSATIATPRESDKKEEVTINISFAGMPLATERAVQDAVAAAVVATANRRGSPLYNKLVR